MRKTISLIVVLCFSMVMAASSYAEVLHDVDFDSTVYDTIAELQADGWVFTGQEGTNVPSGYNIRWQNGEKTLYLDGATGDPNKPSAYKAFGQPVPAGAASFRWSHTASYSNSELQFLDGSGTVIFKVSLNDDTKIKFYNSGSTVDITIPDNTAAPTSVSLAWNAAAGNYSYDVNSGAFTGTLNFVNAGTPEAVLYILNENDNDSREVYLYELSVAAVDPHSGPYYDWINEYDGSSSTSILLYNFNEDQIYDKWSSQSAEEQITQQNPASNDWMGLLDDGTNGAYYGADGKFGWGYHDNGGTTEKDRIRCYNGTDVFPDANDPSLTVECWVKFDNLSLQNTEYIADKQFNQNLGYLLWRNGDRIKFNVGDGTSQLNVQTPDIGLQNDVWYHVAGTWDADTDTLSVWVNADSWSKVISDTVILNSTNELKLGQRAGSTYFGAINGSIDDFRVSSIAYEFAIPPHEGPYYGWGSEYDGADTGTIAYWSLNEDSITLGWSNTDVADVLPAKGHTWGIRKWSSSSWSFGTGGKFGWGIHNPGGTASDTQALSYNGDNIFPTQTDPSLSVEAWVMFNDAAARQFIVSKGNAWSSIGGYDLWYDSGSLKFATGNASTKVQVNAAWTPVVGQWYHVAGTWDADDDTARVYVDGNLINSAASAGLVIEDHTARKTAIGSRTTTELANLNGIIDEVRVSWHAYEFAPIPVCGDPGTEIGGDISGPNDVPDCVVDIYDVRAMASEWLEDTTPTGGVPAAFFTAAPDNSIGFDVDKLYPQGQQFPFSLYSVRGDDMLAAGAAGYTACGPYYGTDQDVEFAVAEEIGFKIMYRVGFKVGDLKWNDPNFLALTDPNIIDTITAQVNAVKDSDAVAWWYITPEEPPTASAAVLHYLQVATDAIRAADPLDRPIYTYHQNGESLSTIENTIQYLDIVGSGAYVNTTGHQDERIYVKYVMEKELDAINGTPGNTNAVPIHAGWMAADPADPNDDVLIEDWVRHDVYLAVATGAKGAVIWSGFRRAGFERTYDAYYDGYGQVATELNGPLGNAVLFGEEKTDIAVSVTAGPSTVSMASPAYTTSSVNYINLADTTGGRYLLVVNSANSAVSVNVSGLPGGTVYVKEIFTEGAFTIVTGTSFAENLDALEVKCFRIIPEPQNCGDEGTYYSPADVSGSTGDSDCFVDLFDFAEISAAWLDCSLITCD